MNIFKKWLENEPKPTIICVAISVVSLVLSLGGWLKAVIPIDIAWIAIVLCGIPIIVGAGVALITEHNIKADLLVSLALIASVITGEFFAAGEVALIMQIGSLLEDFTANRARKGIESLIKLSPKTARVKKDGVSTLIPVEEVSVGDILTVLAGETIPVDGVLISGETTVDQSVMTGESIPVDKKIGDELTSGTVNQYGTFEMRATRVCSDSSLQRMISLAEEADANKAPIVGLADKWASWMVVAALICAVITGVLSGEFIRAVTVLVVFCPCAFVLATPTAVAAAIGNLTKFGVLIRTGDALERLSKVDTVTFDKTGTLTYGKPEVIGVESFTDTYNKNEILKLAASLEERSEHPLGKAIINYCKENQVTYIENDTTQILAGQGLSAQINSSRLLVGKPQFIKESGVDTSIADKSAEDYLNKGATVIYVAVDLVVCGLIALADTIREEAKTAITKLENQQIIPVLLTGDNSSAARYIASEAGIKEVHSGLLPEDKMTIIKGFDSEGKKACMIGDGVNDALALSTAYAGIAMGGVGSDIAVESADAVLVSDDIKRLPYLFHVTKKAMTKVKQNIIISLVIDFAAVVLSFFGILNPVTGALVHNFGSVFVVVNAALLLRMKDK
ncbi:heavy metal translocating P-type ATPase [Pygmaiobacter massiliensis]|uniref:heavy metal translocating P-type ATPase n=1 Tax=Pygmaiobacter massiliensis TaxID=1917873 RepID=UPI0028A272A0|nr:cation-translocating P-type ATPase [Pygmaiobacter massiliensis]